MFGFRNPSLRRKRPFGVWATLLSLTILSVISLLSCQKVGDNPPLAVFDGGDVRENEYVEHFLFSTKYKPNVMPTEENLRKIVRDKADGKMAVLEARARGLERDSTVLKTLHDRVDDLLYTDYVREEIIDSVITDSLIRAFYASYSPQYRMKYIIRAAPKQFSPRVKAAQKDTIEMIYRQLKQGKPFEELAKKYSQDVISGPKGGDLGWLVRESMGDPALRAVMDTLKEWHYSKPFRGMAGYYILYKGDKREVPVPPLEKVRGKIWQTLYRTRRYLIEERAARRFEMLARRYHYRIDSAAVRQIERVAGGKKGAWTASTELDYEKLTPRELNLVVARYDSGEIRAIELFADRKKRPTDMWEFWRRLRSVARHRLFGLDARVKGYEQRPDVQQTKQEIFEALLRDALYTREVRKPVFAALDSIRAANEGKMSKGDLVDLLNRKRHELEEQRRGRLERWLEEKYHFRFLTKNFKHALKVAREKKQEQNRKRAAEGKTRSPVS